MVADASKYRPSIEPMQPSVQCGNSIGAIVVPYEPSRSLSNSHRDWPQPNCSPTCSMVATKSVYSAVPGLFS